MPSSLYAGRRVQSTNPEKYYFLGDDGLILLKDGTVLSVFEIESQVVNTIEETKKETSKDIVYNLSLIHISG